MSEKNQKTNEKKQLKKSDIKSVHAGNLVPRDVASRAPKERYDK